MKFDGHISNEILNQMPLILDYEMLVSTPGIAEPDSGFMWGSNFRAPVGISVLDEKVSFNLFLPSGAEKEKSIMLFFNRVGAKFHDGLWQVRRNMSELSETYENVIKIALTAFPSVVLDYSYIQEGRYYAHFIFNGSELPNISQALLSFSKLIPGYRIEYLSKMEHVTSTFMGVSEIDETATVAVNLADRSGSDNLEEDLPNFYFIMANYINHGVKSVGAFSLPDLGKSIPKVLRPSDSQNCSGGIFSYKCQNEVIMEIMKLCRQNFLILSCIYGVTQKGEITLLLSIPFVQINVLLSILNDVASKVENWGFTIGEVARLRNAIL